MKGVEVMRPLLALAAILLLWQGLVVVADLPPFLLPRPDAVARAVFENRDLLARASLLTLSEVVAGFLLGSGIGAGLALAMAAFPRLAGLMRPVLLLSQVIPIFALAPILTLWLGYGMAPKIAVTALICFFPVGSAFFDGLERLPSASLDLAQSMAARKWRLLFFLRMPMALPLLGSGLKLAAVYAPIGAVIGEWVGGAEGLGAVMIHANGRMRIDLTFAALALVTLPAFAFHAMVSRCVARAFDRYAAP